MIYKDDFVSAFRGICYHPDVLSAYAFVLGAYLVIPVGMVFGSRDALSLFCLLSKMRSFASQFVHRLPLSCPTTLMINLARFPHASHSSRDINLSHTKKRNQGVDITNLGHQPTFFDDTIMEEVKSLIRYSAENSVLPASFFIKNSNLVEEQISIEKFERLFTHLNKTLGFIEFYR